MTGTKTAIATDSAKEFHDLIGDDVSATFESDPKFMDSNTTGGASGDHLELRDTDDTEDSEEEEEEDEDDDIDEEDVDEDDDEESDEDDDEDEEEEDDDLDDEDDEDADEVLRTAEPVDVHHPQKHLRADIEKELEEMEEETGEESGSEILEDSDKEEEGLHKDLAIDEALRMSALSIAGQGY